jgi:hypothetical protein
MKQINYLIFYTTKKNWAARLGFMSFFFRNELYFASEIKTHESSKRSPLFPLNLINAARVNLFELFFITNYNSAQRPICIGSLSSILGLYMWSSIAVISWPSHIYLLIQPKRNPWYMCVQRSDGTRCILAWLHAELMQLPLLACISFQWWKNVVLCTCIPMCSQGLFILLCWCSRVGANKSCVFMYEKVYVSPHLCQRETQKKTMHCCCFLRSF